MRDLRHGPNVSPEIRMVAIRLALGEDQPLQSVPEGVDGVPPVYSSADR